MTEHSEFTHVGYLGGGPCDWNEDSARLNYFEDSQLINESPRLLENIKGLFFINFSSKSLIVLINNNNQ